MSAPVSGTGNAVRMLGKAGEHVVCADLFMRGWIATIASEGQGYDVIAERDGTMVRVAVKSTGQAQPRRTGARDAYRFDVTKRRPVAPKRMRYTRRDCDLIALVTLDTKRVGYLSVDGCPTLIWIFNDDAAPAERRFGPKVSCMRRFDQLTLEIACG